MKTEDLVYEPEGENKIEEEQLEHLELVPGEVIEAGKGNNLKDYILPQEMVILEPIFLIFTNSTCKECKRGATELSKLAKLTAETVKIARIDCTHEMEACDIFVNHIS